jgi:hypothetical protein
MTMTTGDMERAIELTQSRNTLAQIGDELTGLYKHTSATLASGNSAATALERTQLRVAYLLGLLGRDLPDEPAEVASP